MSSTVTKIRTRALAAAFPLLFRVDDRQHPVRRLGSAYGGWWIPTDVLTSESICYCAGVGTDISFDLQLIQEFGCPVFAFDPTPRSISWINSQPKIDDRFTFLPTGLSNRAGTEKFYEPVNADHVSYSAKNIQNTTAFFEAKVDTVAGLMASLGHDRLDLLKLDIEGAEHDTLTKMLADGIRPRIICVEYDQPEPLSWARDTTERLRGAGYHLVKVDTFNLTFVVST